MHPLCTYFSLSLFGKNNIFQTTHFNYAMIFFLRESNFLYSDIRVNLESILKVLLFLDQEDSMAQLLSDIDNSIEIVMNQKALRGRMKDMNSEVLPMK